MSVNKSRELVISSLFILLLAFSIMLTSSFAKAVSFVGEDGEEVGYMENVDSERDYPEDGSERDYPEDGSERDYPEDAPERDYPEDGPRDYPEDGPRDYPEDGPRDYPGDGEGTDALGLAKNGPTFDMEEEEEGKVYIYSDVSVLDMKVGETKSINFSVSPWRTLLKFSAKTDNININIKDYFTFKSKKNPKGYTISVTAKKATEDLELYVIAKVKNDPTTMKKVAINISNIVKSNYAAFPGEIIRKSDLILSKDLINSITMKSDTLIVDGDNVNVGRQMKTGTISYYLNKKKIGSTTITPVGFKSDNYTINAKKVDTVLLWTYTVPSSDIEYHFTIKDQEMGIMDSDMLTPFKNGDIVVTTKATRLSDGKTFEDKAIFTIIGFDEIPRLSISPKKCTLKISNDEYSFKDFTCNYSKKYKKGTVTIDWSVGKSDLNDVYLESLNEDKPDKIRLYAYGVYDEDTFVTVRLLNTANNELISSASVPVYLRGS